MKILIWFSVFFLGGFLNLGIEHVLSVWRSSAIYLKNPELVFAIIVFFVTLVFISIEVAVARFLCRRWDAYKLNKKEKGILMNESGFWLDNLKKKTAMEPPTASENTDSVIVHNAVLVNDNKSEPNRRALYCRKCGAPRPDIGKYCNKCGTEFIE